MATPSETAIEVFIRSSAFSRITALQIRGKACSKNGLTRQLAGWFYKLLKTVIFENKMSQVFLCVGGCQKFPK